jgi:hypothetical protein
LTCYYVLDERIFAKALNHAAICTRDGFVLANANRNVDNRNSLGETRQKLPWRRLVVRGMQVSKPTTIKTATNDFGLSGFERPIQSKSFVLLVPGGGVEPP